MTTPIRHFLAGNFTVYIEPTTGTKAWQFSDLGQYIGVLLQTIIIVAGLGTFVFLILAGVQFITSSGEKVQLEAARGKITAAILGMVIVSGAYVITRVLETVFGVSIVSGIKWPSPL